ncbi:hypothetical protein AGMMS4957_19150 [Bacteroidia bacterium]|nr:hypothetical protein AGMMS4957_19150 [Bacteroidia bacterium]
MAGAKAVRFLEFRSRAKLSKHATVASCWDVGCKPDGAVADRQSEMESENYVYSIFSIGCSSSTTLAKEFLETLSREKGEGFWTCTIDIPNNTCVVVKTNFFL